MGPVNGVQLLKEIKDRRPIMKVIMMTAYPTSETRTQGLRERSVRLPH